MFTVSMKINMIHKFIYTTNKMSCIN